MDTPVSSFLKRIESRFLPDANALSFPTESSFNALTSRSNNDAEGAFRKLEALLPFLRRTHLMEDLPFAAAVPLSETSERADVPRAEDESILLLRAGTPRNRWASSSSSAVVEWRDERVTV